MTHRREHRAASALRRFLGIWFTVSLAASLVGAGWLVWAARNDPWTLVATRNALFMQVGPGPEIFDWSPEQLAAAGFRFDPPELVESWRARIFRDVPYLAGLPEAFEGLTPLEQVRRLVPIFSKNGGGGCGAYDDLPDQFRRIEAGDGQGCCSDHSQVLIAYASALGLVVRQVHHERHTTNELWNPDTHSWIWVDPMYALLARDERGDYLSVRELRERFLSDAPVDFEFIGTDFHHFATQDPRTHPLYDEPGDLESIAILWGNNVFEEDAFQQRLRPAPFILRQFAGLVLGVIPALRFADTDQGRAKSLAERRTAWFVAVPLVAFGWIAWPISLWIDRGWRASNSRGRSPTGSGRPAR